MDSDRLVPNRSAPNRNDLDRYHDESVKKRKPSRSRSRSGDYYRHRKDRRLDDSGRGKRRYNADISSDKSRSLSRSASTSSNNDEIETKGSNSCDDYRPTRSITRSSSKSFSDKRRWKHSSSRRKKKKKKRNRDSDDEDYRDSKSEKKKKNKKEKKKWNKKDSKRSILEKQRTNKGKKADYPSDSGDFSLSPSTSRNTVVTGQWGKYGILVEADMWRKKQEFLQWLMDTRNKSIEDISSWEEKHLFRDYMEDFNTATLPHKKYYDLEAWEAKQSRRTAESGKKMDAMPERTLFNDEATRNEEIKKIRDQRKVDSLREEFVSMKEDKQKIESMKRQQMLRHQMETLFKLGRHEEAQKIQDILRPDEDR